MITSRLPNVKSWNLEARIGVRCGNHTECGNNMQLNGSA